MLVHERIISPVPPAVYDLIVTRGEVPKSFSWASRNAFCWVDDYKLDATWTKTLKEMLSVCRCIILTAT